MLNRHHYIFTCKTLLEETVERYKFAIHCYYVFFCSSATISDVNSTHAAANCSDGLYAKVCSLLVLGSVGHNFFEENIWQFAILCNWINLLFLNRL